jgi:hypothetical protein
MRMVTHDKFHNNSVEEASYGSFVHLMDPEGNKIELGKPNNRICQTGNFTAV